MDGQLLNDDNFKYIIENTIIECNRVLKNWKENNKIIGYDDKTSLFRSYLARFFKHKFGYSAYNRYVKRYHPLVTINNYLLINIDLNCSLNEKPSIYIEKLNKVLQNMDILKFSELNTFTTIKKSQTVNISSLIDYDKLEKIKFK